MNLPGFHAGCGGPWGGSIADPVARGPPKPNSWLSHRGLTVGGVADKSAIEWTEATWNPTTGCDRTSPGCDRCYALTLSKRLKAMGSPKYQLDGDPRTSGPGFGLTLHPLSLDVPRRWSAPRLVFVNSMSDLFHHDVPLEFIKQVFEVIRETPQHTYTGAHQASAAAGWRSR